MFKNLMASACLVFFSDVSFAQGAGSNGPFGFEMKSAIQNYDCVGIQNSLYRCKAPRAHSDFESYIVQATPQHGICFVKAIGKDISTSGYGSGLQAAVDNVASQVSLTYGAPTRKTNFIRPGSLWDEPQYWMMGLSKRDRQYSHTWNNVGKRNVDKIYVAASATSSTTGYIITEFYGVDSESCDEVEKALQAEAF